MEAHQLLAEEGSMAQPATARPAALAERVLDVTLAASALLLLAPLTALIALAIRIDSPGPIIFRQRRLGRNLKPFTVLKFRTMYADADAAPHREYVRSLIDKDDGPRHAGLYKLAVDNRITAVGRRLRAWSLDEVPQLWNVLRGEMSLVGPRPIVPYEVEHYPERYLGRFAVKPGMTGLWQVSGRNERTYDEMVRFDVEYAERHTVRLDLVILFKTVWVVLRRKGVA
jgi:lipopolysaccharide/colanic/teichoic acid biosynthesis glycosyltransferase